MILTSTPIASHEKKRKEIAAHISEFLKNGGSVQHCQWWESGDKRNLSRQQLKYRSFTLAQERKHHK